MRLVLICACLAVFGIGGVMLLRKNQISFLDEGMELRCSFSTQRFERLGDAPRFPTHTPVMETGCRDGSFVVSNIYGYEERSHKLLYVITTGDAFKATTYYAPPQQGTGVVPAGLLRECGGVTVTLVPNLESFTYNYPCTGEVGLNIPNRYVELVRRIDGEAFTYLVSCDSGTCGGTYKLVNTTWERID